MIFLGGGGSEHDEALLWDELFTPGQRVVVWPFAQADPAGRRATGQWFAAALAARGDFTIDTWIDGPRPGLERADVLVVPGGNTFDLLGHLREYDLLTAARKFRGHLYGGSAGAILIGADIAIAAGLDADDTGLDDTSALDLLSGCVVHPHYGPAYEDAARSWSRRHDVTVIGIPERAGVIVDGDRARATGPVEVFTAGRSHAYGPGDSWSLGDR
jgi:dipeptidase E